MHVLSVSSLKGGVGKTTVTLGLASAAFARGVRTLVVDLDPQSDVHASAAYRRHVAAALTRQALAQAAERARGGAA